MKITRIHGENFSITLESAEEAVELYSGLNRFLSPEYAYDVGEAEHLEYPLEIHKEDEHLICEEDFDEVVREYGYVVDALKNGESVTI